MTTNKIEKSSEETPIPRRSRTNVLPLPNINLLVRKDSLDFVPQNNQQKRNEFPLPFESSKDNNVIGDKNKSLVSTSLVQTLKNQENIVKPAALLENVTKNTRSRGRVYHILPIMGPSVKKSREEKPTFEEVPRNCSIMNINKEKKVTLIYNSDTYKKSDPLSSVIPRPKTPFFSIEPPKPHVYEKETGKISMRCICRNTHSSGLLVQCDECKYYLHGLCVCIARTPWEKFKCPYCYKRSIRCKCGEELKFDVPIVKCSMCKYWQHKKCQGLSFGKIPSNYICSSCCSRVCEYPLQTARIDFDKEPFVTCTIDISLKYEILDSIPEGQLRNHLKCDFFDKSELGIYSTLVKYFNEFAPPLFDRNTELWNILVTNFEFMLNLDRYKILRVFDELGTDLLYNKTEKHVVNQTLESVPYSESISQYIEKLGIMTFEEMPKPRLLYTKKGDLVSDPPIMENEFVCELTGFICHMDEIDSDNGIPIYTYTITGSQIVIDTNHSNNPMIIPRGFHYNSTVKLFKVKENLHVGVFGYKPTGPNKEDISMLKRKCTIILPFDANISYKVPPCEWKEKPLKRNTRKLSKEEQSELTLLTAFCIDSVPFIPMQIIDRTKSAKGTGRGKKKNSFENY